MIGKRNEALVDEKKKEQFHTGPLDIVSIAAETHKPNAWEIRENEEAYNLFLNNLKVSEEIYQNVVAENKKLKNKIRLLELKSSERKSAILIMAVAEIITSIGVGGLFTEYMKMALFLLIAGIIMTALALYLNLKRT